MSTQSLPRPVSLFPLNPPAERASFSNDWRGYSRWLRHYGGGVTAAVVLLTLVFGVVFAEWVSPHDPTGGMDLRNRFAPPFWEEGGSLDHPLGTDNMGRDVLARTLHGGRVSLRVALEASTISVLAGAFIGLIGGYYGGMIDRIMQRVMDVWMSFPFLVLALAVIAAVGSSTEVLVTLLALAGWVHPARMTRAQTLKVRQLDYVQAARSIGATGPQILRRHIFPNVLGVNILMWTFSMGTLILIEASLSFIGLGVSPPTPSWGNMLSDGRTYLQDAWWLSVFPGLALMITVLCVNSIGDALQKFNMVR